MPKAVPDYTKNVIYKIQHNDDDSLLYVGHTINFIKQKALHKYNCETHSSPVYKMMRDNGGWECFTMIVIKEYPCINKMEACIEEDKRMREMKASMNNYRAYTSPQEKKKHERQYYQNNKEQLNKKMREYNEANREAINSKQREYNQANREAINSRQKEYYQANRKTILEKNKVTLECECGCIVTKLYLPKHKKNTETFESLEILQS